MKPFNLEDALAGKAVKLRDGRKAYVRHYETELNASESHKLLGYRADGEQISWCENGKYYPHRTNSDDIIGMYPETRIINGFEVPAPETVPLDEGDKYYIANPLARTFHTLERWQNTAADRRWLERGLVFLIAEDAIATAKAMPGIDPNSEDKT